MFTFGQNRFPRNRITIAVTRSLGLPRHLVMQTEATVLKLLHLARLPVPNRNLEIWQMPGDVVAKVGR